MKIINTKQADCLGYIAGYMNHQVGLYAPSLWEAKQLAVAHFKPSKKNAGLLWVTIAEDAQGQPVTQFPD